ncbi:hypothetical protein [Inquilinus sp.]|jgi:hypothetical protein|uniref:hypothetical protein n=1 Tax=Inquilinus sp. TaxID=1932117 RepID=UPI00378508BD
MMAQRALAAALAAAVSMSISSAALAASCAGVEERVNERTGELAGSVLGTIGSVQSKLLARAISEQQLLSSALAALNRQENLSSEAASTALTKSLEAATGVMSTQWQALALKEKTQRFQAIGYEPCQLVALAATAAKQIDAMPAYRQALRDAPANRPGADRTIVARDAWYRRFGASESMPNPDDLLSGDPKKAAAWLDFVMGPPTVPGDGTAADEAVSTVEQREADARRSAAAEAMIAAAAPSAIDPIAQHWSGLDGGMAWSATMAAGDARGTQLDMIAIKAARAAMMADRLDRRLRRLMAVAADAAVRIDTGLGARP